ncbi:MAG: hypothetical protein J6Q54_02225 [Oscillospiraceae bacterium]|nr:hypothetical protein [Oscillospiraceae bacterium]
MKRIVCLLLAALLTFGLFGCNNAAAPETTGATEPVVRDPGMPKKLYASDLAAIPIATDDMTKEELRQLCIKFFELQLTFQWKTDMEMEFFQTNNDKGKVKKLTTDRIYGGPFYQSAGYGNIYRWLEYYDEETGVMPMSVALAEHGGYGEVAEVRDVELSEDGRVIYQKYRSLMVFGNQCTSSSAWAWGRVINSARFYLTNGINVYNGYIPVGCYTYGYEHEGKTYGPLDIKLFGEEGEDNPLGYDTPDVIKDWNAAHGEDAMYKCYAQMKPGDCVVNKGHAMMVKSVNLFISNDGSINYALSTAVVNEQIEGWGLKDNIGGTALWQQGRVDKSVTFEGLQKAGYIPFTFYEFLDENDEQDKKHLDYYLSYADQLTAVKNCYQVINYPADKCGAAIEKAETYCTYTGETITAQDFAAMTVASNYTISDVFVTVTDASGNQLLKNIFRAGNIWTREVSMTAGKSTLEKDAEGNVLPISSGVAELANGENVIEVTMQLSTGELLTAYKGTLAQ